MTWELVPAKEKNTPEKLKITTAWLYDLNDEFVIVLNREEDSFSVKNLADDSESVFVALGTAEAKEKAKSESNNGPTEVEQTSESVKIVDE